MAKNLVIDDKIEMESPTDSVSFEIDEIFSLLAYSIVYNYWDPIDRGGRGYNVGCILVDSNNVVLDYGINHVSELENATQHGEVRLITNYLNKEGIYSLNDHSIYSTLEPCAMCGGMMTMVSIVKSVNGQPDYYFSKALERLSFDSRSMGGYGPYPRIVKSVDTPSQFGKILDEEYKKYISSGNKPIITKFLTTSIAESIYQQATQDFLSYTPVFIENQKVYENALKFYQELPDQPK
ncbi:deaminase [Neolewinella persica]|uniref:deaminase n=1 Tax=Neolewinella persica TaxID=70998 RepID=UPI00146D2150|nr:deaminase [Neolewinella persica]